MGGRGTFAAGNNVAYRYKTVGKIEGVKVLEGINNEHKLPEEAHSSLAYIRLKPDGTFHEIRFYDKNHFLTFEIAYHPEKNLDPSQKPVLHYHVYDKNFKRSSAKRATKAMKKLQEVFCRSKIMMNGNVGEFVDGLYYGDEMLFLYHGIKFFIQGWYEEDGNARLMLDTPESAHFDGYVWECRAKNMSDCVHAFLDAKLFDGKTFYEAEREMTWTDW